MPMAAMRPCSVPGCAELVAGRARGGKCELHRRKYERDHSNQRRAAQIGDDSVYGAKWRRFRRVFVGQLVAAGVLPICGATLPDGPASNPSACKSDGLQTFVSPDGVNLHVHHEPDLTTAERRAAVAGDRSAVDDPRRCVLLCGPCHAAITSRRAPEPST
jgi:hypothetical protein